MKTKTTRTLGPENATEETKEDESSSSYVSMDFVEGKYKKDSDVNSVDNVDNNKDEGKKNLPSAIKKKKGKKNIKRGRGGRGKKRRDG